MDTDRKQKYQFVLKKNKYKDFEILVLCWLREILAAYCLIKRTLIFHKMTYVKLETGDETQSHQKIFVKILQVVKPRAKFSRTRTCWRLVL